MPPDSSTSTPERALCARSRRTPSPARASCCRASRGRRPPRPPRSTCSARSHSTSTPRPGHSARARVTASRDPEAAQVVVLHEHQVGERPAVVDAAAGAHRRLLERAEPGQRLACLADARAAFERRDEPVGRGGDTREVAQEVERGALAGEHRAQAPRDRARRRSSRRPMVPSPTRHGDLDARVDLREHLDRRTRCRRGRRRRATTTSATVCAAASTSAAVTSPSGPRSSAMARATASRTRWRGGSSGASVMRRGPRPEAGRSPASRPANTNRPRNRSSVSRKSSRVCVPRDSSRANAAATSGAAHRPEVLHDRCARGHRIERVDRAPQRRRRRGAHPPLAS